MKKKLGEILVAQGSVPPGDVDSALEQQSGGDPARIGDLLLASGKVTALQLAKALCEQSGLPFVQLDQVSPEVAALVPIELQREHCLVPFREDGPRKAIHVAVADPTTSDVLADLEFQVGRTLKISIAARDEIEAVHAALAGDVLEGAIIEDDAPAPQRSPQALGRLALKRVAVSPAGVMTDAARSSGAMPVAGHGAAVELPRRAKRPVPAAPPPPPMLKPVDPPASSPGRKEPDEWAVRPAASAIPKGTKSVIVPPPPPPVLDPFAAMPTEQIGGPREYVPAAEQPPRVADATLPFGRVTAPLEAEPLFSTSPLFSSEPPPRPPDPFPVEAPPSDAGSGGLPPLSALDADPDLSETLRGPELPPPSRSKLAIDPAPLALTPPPPTGSRQKAHAPSAPPPPAAIDAALEASLFGPEAAEPAPPLPSPVPRVDELDVSAEVTTTRPSPQPVPSGREKRVETRLEFAPKPVSIRDADLGTDPDAPAAPRAPVKTDPAFAAELPRRTESLEFIPPAESAPRPPRPITGSRPAAPLPPELAPPLVPPATPPSPSPALEPAADELPPPRPATPPRPAPAPVEPAPLPPERAATPPQGTQQLERPPATPPDVHRALTPADDATAPETLVSGAVLAPAELTPSLEDPTPAVPPQGDAVLTAAPLEELPPPEASAPVVSPAPIDLAVSELPAWMRDGAPAAEAPGLDALGLALGAPHALQRVVRLLIAKGLLTEAELLEELKKQ